LVTVGEVGIIKKEIIYSGDLLNTTARIMEECKNYNADLIISQDLADSLEIRNKFNFDKIGEIELRGKQNKVALLGVTV
jgi:adenylate cyclase